MTTDSSTRTDLPPIRIAHCDPARREPGMMLFNVRGDTRPAGQQSHHGWLIGVDQAGAITCIHQSDSAGAGRAAAAERQSAGHHRRRAGAGDDARGRNRAAVVRDRAISRPRAAEGRHPGRGGDLPSRRQSRAGRHHAAAEHGDPRVRRLARQRHRSQRAARAREGGRRHRDGGAPDGSKANEWRMLDLLDPYRITYGSRANYWGVRGYPGTMDWCHANGTAYDARDDSILVSLRTQDCIVKFDRKSRRVALDPRRAWQLAQAVVGQAAQAGRVGRVAIPPARLLDHAGGHHPVLRQRQSPRAAVRAADAARRRATAARSSSRSMSATARCRRSGAMARRPASGSMPASRAARCGCRRPATRSSPMAASARSTAGRRAGPTASSPAKPTARQDRHPRAAHRGDAGQARSCSTCGRRRARRSEGAVGVPLGARAGVAARFAATGASLRPSALSIPAHRASAR